MTRETVIPSPIFARVDDQTPETWAQILEQFCDAGVYQTWAYGSVRWGSGNLSHLVLYRNGVAVAAAQLRIARLPVLGGIAYLRWGPLCHRKGGILDPAVAREMFEALRKEYCANRGLSLQVIPNAFEGHDRYNTFAETLSSTGLQLDTEAPTYRTVVVDLTRSPETIRKGLDQKWRNQLNGSERNGLSFEASSAPEAYAEFLQLYQGMLERKKFETSVDELEFGKIQDQLEEPQKMKIFIARKDGNSVGALVCSNIGDTAIYLLGATNELARALKASYFLHWQAMIWMKERGTLLYDLGGVDAKSNPGGHHFKTGFGGEEVTQLRGHVVHRGALGRALFWAASWIRRRKSSKLSRSDAR